MATRSEQRAFIDGIVHSSRYYEHMVNSTLDGENVFTTKEAEDISRALDKVVKETLQRLLG